LAQISETFVIGAPACFRAQRVIPHYTSHLIDLGQSSTTDRSSTPLTTFDHKSCEESKTNAFSTQLKRLYHNISLLRVEGQDPRGVRQTPRWDPYLCHQGGAHRQRPKKRRTPDRRKPSRATSASSESYFRHPLYIASTCSPAIFRQVPRCTT